MPTQVTSSAAGPDAFHGSLFHREHWQRTRAAFGVGGHVGLPPDTRLACAAAAREEERRRGLQTRSCSAVPALGLVSLARRMLEADGGCSLEDVRAATAAACGGEATIGGGSGDGGGGGASCVQGAPFVVVRPPQDSGRHLLFSPDRQRSSSSSSTAAPVRLDADLIYVIPDFAAFWEIPAAPEAYQRFHASSLAGRHRHFVGTAARLFCLLESIEAALATTFSQGSFPPWRTAAAWKQHLVSPLVGGRVSPECGAAVPPSGPAVAPFSLRGIRD